MLGLLQRANATYGLSVWSGLALTVGCWWLSRPRLECVLTATFEILESVQSTVGKVDSLVLLSGGAASPTDAGQGQTSNVPHLLLLQRGVALRVVLGSELARMTLKDDVCVGTMCLPLTNTFFCLWQLVFKCVICNTNLTYHTLRWCTLLIGTT